MSSFALYSIAFWAGFMISYLLFKWSQSHKQPEEDRAAEDAKRLAQYQLVLAIFEDRDRIKNNDVELKLGVSDATATRILDELEASGKITAHKKTKGTYYTLS